MIVYDAIWSFLTVKDSQLPERKEAILVMKHYLPSMQYAHQQKSSIKELTNFIYYIFVAYKTIYLMDEYH